MKCIPSYVKYITLAIFVGMLVILSVFYAANLMPMILAMVFAIMQSRVKCMKYKNPLLKDKNGWYIFTMRPTCRHCGQDTLLCEIEEDEVTEARLDT